MSEHGGLLNRVKALSAEIPQLTHNCNFLVGAVYSLREARERGHRDRATYGAVDPREHPGRLHRAIEAVVRGQTPEPVWSAGFFYNAALMRVDACYERFLKAMLEAAGVREKDFARTKPQEAQTDALATRLETALSLSPPLARRHLAWARGEVNKLKHKLYGRQPSTDPVSSAPEIEKATAALAELVALMERPDIRPVLVAHFAQLPPP